ncbi:GNAT family N-acetyltransferase [Pseudotabrizicola algicola]|uniref:GNAT family N-acetyltransferase n=1 Tax=Pseudotabrizicola algicola TaxID=2709381 RepID=A0A6B3RSU4_9RHOB|nr:GNAT family N-acetyltransferase [Pseudotabrizicola algicola]NEX47085.1 GNAT family N-acetyltransferase [Pseudotabrizicola algicola]
MIHPLDPLRDRAAVADLLTRAQDYYHLWLGHPPGPAQVEDVFTAGPPGCDPAASHRLGLWHGDTLAGVAELSFGFPAPPDAYLGLMILAPEARSQGQGATFLAHVESLARAAKARHLYLAVLEANARGAAFWARRGFAPTGLSRHDTGTGHTLHRLVKPL